jgi:glycosyltransferase involved in cell wall biosynthesis
MTPFVTVLVPNYNHARYLPQRLDSIVAQTFHDYELIALDDCSTDDSREVLAEYARRVPMRLLLNDKNSGTPFIQWRRGAEAAAGEYLWIAESDDFADPRLLETLVDRVRRHPGTGIAYCQSLMVNERGETIGNMESWTAGLDPERWTHDFTNRGADEVARYLVRRNTIPNASAALVRRDLLLDAVRDAERLRLAGDWWTWARVLMNSDVAFVAEPLNRFRMHERSVRDTTAPREHCQELFTVMAHICSRVAVAPEARLEAFREAFRLWLRCLATPGFRPDAAWLWRVHADARRVFPGATTRMAWHLARWAVGLRPPGVAPAGARPPFSPPESHDSPRL